MSVTAEDDENIELKFTKGKIPLSQMSVYSMIPTNRSIIPPEFTYFNSSAKEKPVGTIYDRTFHKDSEYNNKLHRCDRAHSKHQKLEIHLEEENRKVPAKMSSVYGRKIETRRLEHHDGRYARVIMTKNFKSTSGVSLNVNTSYGGILPM